MRVPTNKAKTTSFQNSGSKIKSSTPVKYGHSPNKS